MTSFEGRLSYVVLILSLCTGERVVKGARDRLPVGS